MRTFLTLPLLLLAGIAGNALGDGDPLAKSFRNPPAAARPHTWWHWMNGNITREGITADLEAMNRVGVGGAQIFNVDCGIPAGPVQFMSEEWRKLFKHAVQEADRLGIEICVHNSAGWTSSGGPWNPPELAMQKIVTSEIQIHGPSNFSAELPAPETRLGFYRDIAVLAFPLPQAERVSMRAAKPTLTSAGSTNLVALTDNDTSTAVEFHAPLDRSPHFVDVEFPKPFTASSLKLLPNSSRVKGKVQISDDGKTFREVQTFTDKNRTPTALFIAFSDKPITSRFWRVTFDTPKLNLAELELSPRNAIGDWQVNAGYLEKGTGAMTSVAARDGIIPLESVRDLTQRMDPHGRLEWNVPSGDWVILRIGHTPTTQKNHPAPPEGTGLECDKLNAKALDHHWAGFMQKILDDVGALAPRTLNNALVDSYEVGGQNWTENFRAEFRRRRGYDLIQFLPVFAGRVVDNSEITDRFLWDVRKTVADLMAENYFGHFAKLCRERGLLTSIEPYTGPFESLECGRPADIVMGEFWSDSQGHRSVKIAASVAHIYGKQIVGAESFTAWPETGRWQKDPASLKALGDLMYCQGINRFIFHRYAHQPWTNRWPGMTMGQWGFHFERTSTWFEQSKPWIDYLTRCQYLLQQGHSVADVAYFCGETVPVELRFGEPALPAGYDFDGINADVLLHRTTVQDGFLTLPHGVRYAALVLPPSDSNMTPKLLERVAKLARDGATIIGPPPLRSPSFEGYPQCDEQVKKLADAIWGACDGKNITENRVGRGRAVWGKSLQDVLAAQGLKPDFEYTGGSSETKLAYVHRIAGDVDIYFVSNQRQEFEVAECTFRVTGKAPELWQAETGEIEPAPVWRDHEGRTKVRLALAPNESVFVVFRKPAANDHIVSVTASAFSSAPEGAGVAAWQPFIRPSGEVWVKAWANGNARIQTAGGKQLAAVVTGVPAPREISGDWEMAFPINRGAPPLVRLDDLISWPRHADEGVRFFSGTATYEKDLEVPVEWLVAGQEVWLDLGRVKNIAEVSLNGRELGILWKMPFRVNVTPAAKAGVNRLKVKVTNLWPNRLIGDEHLPPDAEWKGKQLAKWPQWFLEGKSSPSGRYTFTTWHHWTKGDALLESGLLGPVILQAAVIVAAE